MFGMFYTFDLYHFWTSAVHPKYPKKTYHIIISSAVINSHQTPSLDKAKPLQLWRDTSYYKYYPLENIQKAIENGPVEIVDLPIDSMVIFHSYNVSHGLPWPVRHRRDLPAARSEGHSASVGRRARRCSSEHRHWIPHHWTVAPVTPVAGDAESNGISAR